MNKSWLRKSTYGTMSKKGKFDFIVMKAEVMANNDGGVYLLLDNVRIEALTKQNLKDIKVLPKLKTGNDFKERHAHFYEYHSKSKLHEAIDKLMNKGVSKTQFIIQCPAWTTKDYNAYTVTVQKGDRLNDRRPLETTTH